MDFCASSLRVRLSSKYTMTMAIATTKTTSRLNSIELRVKRRAFELPRLRFPPVPSLLFELLLLRLLLLIPANDDCDSVNGNNV